MIDAGLATIQAAVRERGPDGDYRDLGRITVRRRDHLLIFNYTNLATYAREWTPVERVSRGLIIDGTTGEVVARAFDKFFNLGEQPETQIDALPQEPFEVFDKADGSLGILYRHNGQYAVATRGSFDGPQAQWATAWLNANHDLSLLPAGTTLLFEIIYPENRIVLDYGGWSGLILLAAKYSDGREYDYENVQAMGQIFGFRVVERYDMPTLAELVAQTGTATGIEGWIVRFASGLRLKVKCEQYLQLHRAIFGITPERIREALLGDWPAFLAAIPEELRPGIEAQGQQMIDAVLRQEQDIRSALDFLRAQLNVDAPRKSYAYAIMVHYRDWSKYLFALLDGKSINEMLLKALDLKALGMAEPEVVEVVA